MRSLSESEGRGRATSDNCWVGPGPSYVHAMSTTPEHGAERMVSFHASELTNMEDEADEASGSIARSRLLFGKVSIEVASYIHVHSLGPPLYYSSKLNLDMWYGKNRPPGFCPKMGQAFSRELASI